jgi:DNA modification methylase
VLSIVRPPVVATGSGRWGDSEWALLQGDCRLLLPQLAPATVNCVTTSPPYFWQRDYKVAGQIGLEPSIEAYIEAIRHTFRGIHHVLRKDGVVFLNLGDTYFSAKGQPRKSDAKHRARRFGLRLVDSSALAVDAAGVKRLRRKTLLGIPWRVAHALMADGWILRSPIVWVRDKPIPEPTATDRPWRRYEFVFIFAKSTRYYFNRDALQGEEDVWYIPTERNAPSRGTHYAPYPRELVRRCLAAGCPPGGLVLDPFLGGGTTMGIALASGRPAVGIELSPEFCMHVVKHMDDPRTQAAYHRRAA